MMLDDIDQNHAIIGQGGNQGESIPILLLCEIIFYILVLANKFLVNQVSYIDSGWMTKSELNHKSNSDNTGFVEIVFKDIA